MKFFLPSIPILAAMSGIASATVVNIDFGTSLLTNVYVGQAAAADPAGGGTAKWNPLLNMAGTASSTNLKDSTDNDSGIGFSLTGIDGSISNASTEAETGGGFLTLMRDYVYVDSGSSTIVKTLTGSFTGLIVGATYELYFYGQGEFMSTTSGSGGFRGQNSYFEVNGSGDQTGWDGVAGGNGLLPTLAEGIEFVKFTTIATDGGLSGGVIGFDFENVVPGVGGNVVADDAPSSTGGGARRGALNAIQLVHVVPEPSTALLGILGTLGLLVRRRR